MRFVNEYEMTQSRYVKWSTANVLRLPVFYLYLAIFATSIFAWVYFAQNDVATRWETLAAFMALISAYRGYFYGKMAAGKQFRLTKQELYKNADWMCKVEVNNAGIRVSANGKMNAYIKWDRVSSFQEAKSFFDIKVDGDENQARLDKACFTEGDAESFKKYMLEEHSDIPYKEIDARWNK